jgi:trans-aconitate 2-methyltransferase
VSWNPELYLRFGEDRTRPSVDLVARVELAAPYRIIDLGCGPGNSTAILRSRWPEADITGLDNDPAMLQAAALTDPRTTWIQGDAGNWSPGEPFDLVYSNAMIQWLPDHATLIPRLFQGVAEGGALAVQVPVHTHSPLHQDILQVADDPRWRTATREASGAIVHHDADFYYDVLCALAPRIDLWVTEYCHVLERPEAILAWIQGTGLRPFLAALPSDADRQDFERQLLDRLRRSYPRRRDGRVVFPFRRLFFIAYRA